ncbi:MAG: ABC transporter ATP-binding protein [Spirochaetales bacterium]|nr:ABC transporter ATP-binding protein [Spirochaetales bacterium]MCF7939222.1 ABC transporter ATP-binding protein [Spirochaetales bacterium]
MLEIRDLNSHYGKLHVLRDINLQIGNESVGLFGPNGSGKTTLINAVMGLWKPTSGSINFNEEDITNIDTYNIARKGIALVPQERELFPGMNVQENLESGAAYIPHAKDELESSLENVYSIFPILKERSKQLAVTLSGGQQRMLAVGRALMAKPKLLILDEPSLGLQPSLVSELFEKLAEMKETVSILVTEQNVRESLKAVDRGYVLENGSVALEDSAEGLSTNPHVIKSYLGL